MSRLQSKLGGAARHGLLLEELPPSCVWGELRIAGRLSTERALGHSGPSW